ncbi:MAG TPA: DUF374 domain-containing protein [Caulobacteraceae bacterium]|nr:DUF374 domain-containing protein [Caulobacteraceae bacterium]
MKALLRSAPVQGLLAVIAWAYLGLVLRTVRWTHVNRERLDAELALSRGAIGCIWHGAIPLVIGVRPALRGRAAKVLISLSPDGEFITRAIAAHGVQAIRGSKAKGGKAKGGAAAFRECIDWVAGGGLLLVTPDGPRGPAEVMSSGVARMAKLAQAPVYMIGLAARPASRAKSWDRTWLPRPFGRGAVVWDGPYHLPAEASESDMDQALKMWSAALKAAGARAEAALA